MVPLPQWPGDGLKGRATRNCLFGPQRQDFTGLKRRRLPRFSPCLRRGKVAEEGDFEQPANDQESSEPLVTLYQRESGDDLRLTH